mgnify:CR=1 FL=1
MNGTKVLLDTNIVLYVLNGDEQIGDFDTGRESKWGSTTSYKLAAVREVVAVIGNS